MKWYVAVAVLAMVFIHEQGHLKAAYDCGLEAQGMYFIPFMGGIANISGYGFYQEDDFMVAIMGPIYGLICSIIMFASYLATDIQLYGQFAKIFAIVNIFNLMPIFPLDGGRIWKSLSFSICGFCGFLFFSISLCLCIFLWHFSFIFFFFAYISYLQFLSEIKSPRDKIKLPFFRLLASFFIYFSTVFIFGVIIYTCDIPVDNLFNK